MIEIDGSMGEGGGQVLRSSLTLSVLTGQPVHLVNVRAGRPKPGLQPQHLMSVKAAATICNAEVDGAYLHSRELTFRPGPVQLGDYRFDIGTAGATSLVIQTVFLHFSLGALGKRAEQVADEACLWMERFLSGSGTVDEYLADQVLLPLAFAEDESRFRTAQVTEHLRTNAGVVEAFGVSKVTIEKDGGREGVVRVRPLRSQVSHQRSW